MRRIGWNGITLFRNSCSVSSSAISRPLYAQNSFVQNISFRASPLSPFRALEPQRRDRDKQGGGKGGKKEDKKGKDDVRESQDKM